MYTTSDSVANVSQGTHVWYKVNFGQHTLAKVLRLCFECSQCLLYYCERYTLSPGDTLVHPVVGI